MWWLCTDSVSVKTPPPRLFIFTSFHFPHPECIERRHVMTISYTAEFYSRVTCTRIFLCQVFVTPLQRILIMHKLAALLSVFNILPYGTRYNVFSDTKQNEIPCFMSREIPSVWNINLAIFFLFPFTIAKLPQEWDSGCCNKVYFGWILGFTFSDPYLMWRLVWRVQYLTSNGRRKRFLNS